MSQSNSNGQHQQYYNPNPYVQNDQSRSAAPPPHPPPAATDNNTGGQHNNNSDWDYSGPYGRSSSSSSGTGSAASPYPSSAGSGGVVYNNPPPHGGYQQPPQHQESMITQQSTHTPPPPSMGAQMRQDGQGMPPPPPPPMASSAMHAPYDHSAQDPYGGPTMGPTATPPPPQQQQPQQQQPQQQQQQQQPKPGMYYPQQQQQQQHAYPQLQGGYPDYEGSYQFAQHYQQAQQPVDRLAGSMQQMNLNQRPQPQPQPQPQYLQQYQQYQQQQQYQQPNLECVFNIAQNDQLPRPQIELFAQEEIQQSNASVLFQRLNQGQQADFSKAQASSRYIRATVQSVPNSPTLMNKWALPYGIIIQPFNDNPEEKIPVINATKSGVQRCYKCRTYINPFITWMDGGLRWQCNICRSMNDVPGNYRCNLDQFGCRLDIKHRPELRCGTVEYVAPSEYMARPPQPPVFLFLIDVSAPAIANGMVQTVARTIRESLDNLPGDSRTRVGFITFDKHLHFYNLKSTLSQPRMYSVGELNETLLPIPLDLVVSLRDSRRVVDALLDKLENKLFVNTAESDVALGPALNAAGRLISRCGGKVMCFISNIPNIGPHSLKNREDLSLYGKDKEKTLFNEAMKTYKELALLYSRDQISADLLVCSDQHVDIATLGCLPKFTGGEVKYYPQFHASADCEKLKHDLTRILTRKQGLESVMRIRVSTGMKVSNFLGNFFLRGHDLLALPTIDADKTYTIELSHDGGVLPHPSVCTQTAILYTATNGERRIRVHTLLLPVTSSLADMYRYADIDVTMAVMAKIAASEVPRKGLEPTRARIRDTITNTIALYKKEVSSNQNLSQHNLLLPKTLKLLPLFGNCLVKSDILLSGNEIRADDRMAALHRINVDSLLHVMFSIHPLLFNVTIQEDQLQMENVDDPKQGHLSAILPLTQRYMSDDEVYVLRDSSHILLWIGKNVATTDEFSELLDVVNMLNSNNNRVKKTESDDDDLTKSDSDADAVRDIAEYTPRARNLYHMVVLLRLRYGYSCIKSCSSNPALERLFLRRLMEDRIQQGAMAYDEFCQQVQQSVAKRM